MGLPNPSRETKFSGMNADREIFTFPVQLTTSRIDNLAQLIHTLAICVTIHTYIRIEGEGRCFDVKQPICHLCLRLILCFWHTMTGLARGP